MPSSTWFRAVVIADAHTDWEPQWGLRQQGDGPYVSYSVTGIKLLFASLREAVAWVEQHNPEAFVELPSSIKYKG